MLVFGSVAVNAQDLTWYDNVDKAMEVSKKSKKPLMLFFTVSDWCGWCIRLQKEVFLVSIRIAHPVKFTYEEEPTEFIQSFLSNVDVDTRIG